MSFTKKLFDGVTSLLDQVVADEEPLSGVGEEGLRAEVAARKAYKEQFSVAKPGENPLAKLAGLGKKAAAVRERKQKKRREDAARQQKRYDADRRKREEEEFKRMKEKAYSSDFGTSSSSYQSNQGNPWSRSNPPPPRFGGLGRNAEIAKHYKALDLPYGAPFTEVKSAYRKLMRKYHPDFHTSSPKKQKAANELSVRVTQAYNAIENYLDGK